MLLAIKNIFRQSPAFILISFIICLLSELLKSNFLINFLKNDLIIILITILAINTATSSILLSKLRDLSEKNSKSNFFSSYESLQSSLYEQIILIILAIVFLMLDSSAIINMVFKYHNLTFNTLITSIFIFSIDILRDTGNAIFIIVKPRK